jgi:hypothetical protein
MELYACTILSKATLEERYHPKILTDNLIFKIIVKKKKNSEVLSVTDREEDLFKMVFLEPI